MAALVGRQIGEEGSGRYREFRCRGDRGPKISNIPPIPPHFLSFWREFEIVSDARGGVGYERQGICGYGELRPSVTWMESSSEPCLMTTGVRHRDINRQAGDDCHWGRVPLQWSGQLFGPRAFLTWLFGDSAGFPFLAPTVPGTATFAGHVSREFRKALGAT